MLYAESTANVRSMVTKGVAKISSACVKIGYRSVEISIAFDDSCGALPKLGRVDIRVFGGIHFEKDITDVVKRKRDAGIYPVGIEDLVWVKRRIDRAYKLGLIPK